MNPINPIIRPHLEVHKDGEWMTSEYLYKERKLIIKMRKGHGSKIHVFLPNSDKVEFTLHYVFITTESLLTKAINKIDKNYLNLK